MFCRHAFLLFPCIPEQKYNGFGRIAFHLQTVFLISSSTFAELPRNNSPATNILVHNVRDTERLSEHGARKNLHRPRVLALSFPVTRYEIVFVRGSR